MMTRAHGEPARGKGCVLPMVAALLICVSARSGLATCATVDAVVAALFEIAPSTCDVNDDAVVSAADLSASIAFETPPPTATRTPTRTASSSPTPTPTPTPTPSVTPTAPLCPTSGAGLAVE